MKIFLNALVFLLFFFPIIPMAESDVKSSSATTSSASPAYIHPRREPFDRCQLPITKLIFTDGT